MFEIGALTGSRDIPGRIGLVGRGVEVGIAIGRGCIFVDRQQILTFANTKGIDTLSMWAIQRDNGGCPGARAANDCSGIAQGTWAFSHVLAPFTAP